ncbi:MAG: hypothetical protein QXP27_09940, partial [Candidatus Methanomethyliaceae archaeon]
MRKPSPARAGSLQGMTVFPGGSEPHRMAPGSSRGTSAIGTVVTIYRRERKDVQIKATKATKGTRRTRRMFWKSLWVLWKSFVSFVVGRYERCANRAFPQATDSAESGCPAR